MHRILVVDDEVFYQKAIGRIFADSDYLLHFADNGRGALEAIDNFKPDLVLLDVMMPGMDGYEVCRQLKSMEDTAGIMVLFLSGRGATEDKIRAYRAAGDDYITKPYDAEELRAKVQILLRLKKTQDDLLATNRNQARLIEAKTRQLVKKERQAIIGQMIQGIVHNLRGPITAIGGMTMLATAKIGMLQKQKNLGENETQACDAVRKYLDNVLVASSQMEKTIENMLLKSRNEAIQDKQSINLNEVITRELDFLNSDITIKHKIKKKLELSPTLPKIYGVYTDFSQICYNMIRNAADAMTASDRKELTISTRHDGDNIYLEFKDTGAGIRSEDLEHIFEPFFTTKQMKSDRTILGTSGTGLGLHTCKELMENYGGIITVKSELELGTTFTITIPLQSK